MGMIKVDQFAILASKPVDSPDINIESNYSIDAKNKAIGCLVKIKYRDGEDLQMLLDVICGFSINHEDWDEMADEKSITIPKGFLRHITLHTIGTARGIMHCKTEATPMNQYILPPINLEEMIKEDVTFPLE